MRKSVSNLSNLRKRISEISLRTSGSAGLAIPSAVHALSQIQLGLFEVSRRSAKELDSIFLTVLERFHMERDLVRIFISSEQNIQGSCLITGRDSAAIIISAGSINMLDSKEIEFVFGHELAHLIKLDGADKTASLKEQRYSEIDADRVGLFACGNLDVGLSALIKSATGMTSRHFPIKVGDFLQQAQDSAGPAYGADQLTHPPAVIRARALAKFGSQIYYKNIWEPIDRKAVERVNALVESELNEAVDYRAAEEAQAVLEDLNLWRGAESILGDAPREQDWANFEQQFGPELATKMRSFYRNHKSDEISVALRASVAKAKTRYSSLIA